MLKDKLDWSWEGNSTVWLFLDTKDALGGLFLTPRVQGAVEFQGLDELVMTLNILFDDIDFPQRYSMRRRAGKGRAPVVGIPRERLRDAVTLREMERMAKTYEWKGYLPCLIHVEQRKNTDWQGEIKLPWQVDSVRFRGVLSLMKLLCSAAETVRMGLEQYELGQCAAGGGR